MYVATISVLLAAVLCTAAPILNAQEDGARPVERVGSVTVEPVVVGATRAEGNAPVTQNTIDSAALRAVVVGQDLQYVLERTAPSIVAYSESGTNFSNYGSFRLRGMDQTRVNVTLNGAPLNDMIDQGVFFSNITDLGNGMQSVQVQRGVGVGQNGTASYAGSVNLQSPTLSNTVPSGRVQLNAGSFGLIRGSAEVLTGATDANVSLYAKATAFQTDGYRERTGTASFSGQFGATWFGSSDVVRFTAVGGRTDNQLGYLPVAKAIADADPRTNVNDATDHDSFGQFLMQLEWSRQLSTTGTLGVMAYYGGAGGDYYAGFRDDDDYLTQVNYPLTNRHLGGIATATFQSIAPQLDLTVGLHLYRFWRRNWETLSPESERPYYDDRTVKDEASGFARLAWEAGSLQILAEVQVRRVTMQFLPDPGWVPEQTIIPIHDWFFVNPKLSVGYTLARNSVVYASLGRTGREPTRFDLLGGTQINEGNVHVLTDPGTVAAEYATDAELGIRWASSRWTLDVNGFAMFFTNEIAPIGPYIDQWFVQLRKNVPTSERIGIELAASVMPIPQLRLSMQATWMKATIGTYTPENAGLDTTYTNVNAVLTPEFMGWFSAEVRPVKPLAITATLRAVSKQWLELTNQPSLRLDGFAVADVGISWTVMNRHRMGVSVNNVLDKRYAANGAPVFDGTSTVPAVFMQAGRNVMVMVELGL